MANNFLSRWSQRKLEEQSLDKTEQESASLEKVQEEEHSLDESVAELEGEQEDTASESEHEVEGEELSISQLLANTEVDKAVKKAALRKLFMQPEFNVVDGLNDYDHDYSAVKPLATEVAETLRGWVKDVEEHLEESEGSDESALAASIPDETEVEEEQTDNIETLSGDEESDSKLS
ncbi:DUF3306 domain-containing protein [Vibrio maritimus]|uniref:DUF3306 domain-containing protein n=1 Tax=Vibrio maritimus TaxID=990268 RepID=UPI001F374EDD|nr:DUF3306 domain-containing protein [Vibrio maritimus]